MTILGLHRNNDKKLLSDPNVCGCWLDQIAARIILVEVACVAT
jgi:hypothetical protein